METAPAVSVVVATYNRCERLNGLLCALAKQTFPLHQFEVVVVDDGSTDRTQALLRTINVPYALRSFAQANRGPAAARNRGVEEARGDLVIFLDDDVIPVPAVIQAHVDTHGETTNRVVTGPMSPPPREWPQPIWDRWDAAQLAKQYRAMQSGVFPCSQRQFFTANASVRRQLFRDVGGFDPTFTRAEDMELAWRLSGGGARFMFQPRADVLHYSARRFSSWRRNAYLYGRYDVVMSRDKAIPVFPLACQEFHTRHPANRWLTRLCVGRRLLSQAVVLGLAGAVQVASSVGAERIASLALSSIFNVQYWQGASDELGRTERLRQEIERPNQHQPARADA
jgi:GT2 family glycosyltransferase